MKFTRVLTKEELKDLSYDDSVAYLGFLAKRAKAFSAEEKDAIVKNNKAQLGRPRRLPKGHTEVIIR